MSAKESNLKPQQSGTTTKLVYSKLDYSWFLVGTYLDIMRGIRCISCDKEFSRLFDELRDYVDKKLTMQYEGDINDIFVIAEQIIKSD